jgi:hypothetical protein
LNSHFEPHQPYWQDYLSLLDQLTGHDFPSCSQLNALLPAGLNSKGGQAIKFVDSNQLDNESYENRIYHTGQVSTRPDSWHDLFNALVWMRYPRIKTAMNSRHYQAGAALKSGSRGPQRDALTLFDECGVIVFSNHMEILGALAERRWSDAFLADAFRSSVELSVCGHAMLEKYLSPYKAMTANALLVYVNVDFMKFSRQEMLDHLDTEIARCILNNELLSSPACLSPLPLAGVPGWWPQDEQCDVLFYNDSGVFRPPPDELIPAPVLYFTKDHGSQSTL